MSGPGHCHACGAPLTPAVSLGELSALLDRADLRTFNADRAISFMCDAGDLLRRLIEERMCAVHDAAPPRAEECAPLLGPDDTHHDIIPPTLRSENP